jgi:hypothetical protein
MPADWEMNGPGSIVLTGAVRNFMFTVDLDRQLLSSIEELKTPNTALEVIVSE